MSAEFQKLKDGLIASLVAVTNASKFLKPSEVLFFRSDLALSQKFDALGDNAVFWINALANIGKLDAIDEKDASSLIVDSVDEEFTRAVHMMDDFYEQADMYLDNAVKKMKSKKSLNDTHLSVSSAFSCHSSKPQLEFKDRVNNSNNPWIPIIKVKPNAKRPLAIQLSLEIRNHLSTLGHSSPAHPYKWEIESIEYQAELYITRAPINYESLENTPLSYIDTLASLQELVKKLNSEKEIAVDLEHHDYRSFQGFTCLIQISTRAEDFIIDAIKLRHELHLLNESFTNPSIIKVLHGAEMDIIWLQRDFGVYVVGLFDSFHASHCLEMPKHSFAYLLENYCGIQADKKYQRADWRKRPLSNEMINYARSDTHYLLYIYDLMRNQMLEKSENLMKVTLERSAETSLKTYQKPLYDSETGDGPGGWKNLLRRHPEALNEESFEVFRAIHGWRDHIARIEDESTAYVMPNYVIFKLSRYMPTTAKDVLAGCSPVPPLTRLNATDIAKLIEQTLKSVRDKIHNASCAVEVVISSGAAAPILTLDELPPLHISKQKDESSAILVNQKPSSNLFGDLLQDAKQPAGFSLAEEVTSELFLVAPSLEQEYTDNAIKIGKNTGSAPVPKEKEDVVIIMKKAERGKRAVPVEEDAYEVTAVPLLTKKQKPSFDFAQAQEDIEIETASKLRIGKKDNDPLAHSGFPSRAGKKGKGKGRSGKM